MNEWMHEQETFIRHQEKIERKGRCDGEKDE
jgi:hypothetical protein